MPPPLLIAHLVKFLGHIFHLDKLDCISRVSMHFSQIYNSEMLAIIKYTCLSLTGMAVRGGDYRGDDGDTLPSNIFWGTTFWLRPRPPPFRRNRRHCWDVSFNWFCGPSHICERQSPCDWLFWVLASTCPYDPRSSSPSTLAKRIKFCWAQ